MTQNLMIALALVAAALAVVGPGGAASPDAGKAARVVDPPALRPMAGDQRLVVVLADNSGTETTDLLVPHGILERSGSVEVLIVSTEEGPVDLMPALRIRPDMTIAAFQQAFPRGADAVVVPALHNRGTEATTAFLAGQARLGAMVVAICEGSDVVGRAGLLDGRAATTHWFARNRMQRHYPDAYWIENTRYVVDGPTMSSSGVSASVPVTLALLELLEGHETARRTADMLGVTDWNPAHDSTRFSLDAGKVLVAAVNSLGFWRHERLHAPVEAGFDGVAFALQADAWSRTYRSRLFAQNDAGAVTSAEGVTYLTETGDGGVSIVTALSGAPFQALDASLEAIAVRYDERTAGFVASQLEYPWSRGPER